MYNKLYILTFYLLHNLSLKRDLNTINLMINGRISMEQDKIGVCIYI